jgi:hypothetical protein
VRASTALIRTVAVAGLVAGADLVVKMLIIFVGGVELFVVRPCRLTLSNPR